MAKNMSARGEYFNKLVARLSAVEQHKDAGSPKTAGESLNALEETLLQPGLQAAYLSDAVYRAESMIRVMRLTQEGLYRQFSDEEIAKVIMEAAEKK